MFDITEALINANQHEGKLGRLLASLNFDFDADEFIIMHPSKDELLEENPDLYKDELDLIGMVLVPAFNNEGELKYKGHEYCQCENDFYSPEYSLCLYDEKDWTMTHKLLDYVNQKEIFNCDIPEEFVDKIYVQCDYTGFGR